MIMEILIYVVSKFLCLLLVRIMSTTKIGLTREFDENFNTTKTSVSYQKYKIWREMLSVYKHPQKLLIMLMRNLAADVFKSEAYICFKALYVLNKLYNWEPNFIVMLGLQTLLKFTFKVVLVYICNEINKYYRINDYIDTNVIDTTLSFEQMDNIEHEPQLFGICIEMIGEMLKVDRIIEQILKKLY